MLRRDRNFLQWLGEDDLWVWSWLSGSSLFWSRWIFLYLSLQHLWFFGGMGQLNQKKLKRWKITEITVYMKWMTGWSDGYNFHLVLLSRLKKKLKNASGSTLFGENRQLFEILPVTCPFWTKSRCQVCKGTVLYFCLCLIPPFVYSRCMQQLLSPF